MAVQKMQVVVQKTTRPPLHSCDRHHIENTSTVLETMCSSNGRECERAIGHTPKLSPAISGAFLRSKRKPPPGATLSGGCCSHGKSRRSCEPERAMRPYSFISPECRAAVGSIPDSKNQERRRRSILSAACPCGQVRCTSTVFL